MSFCSFRHEQKVSFWCIWEQKQKDLTKAKAEVTILKIREILRTKFEETIPSDIKYYDNDVEEWVDLESDSEECIQNLKVIKVTIFEKSKENNDVTSNKIIYETPGLLTLLRVQIQKNMSPERQFASVIPATPSRPVSSPSRSTSPPSKSTTPASSSTEADINTGQNG